MSGLFEDIVLFDEGKRVAQRKSAAVAQKRVDDRVGSFLAAASDQAERDARLSLVEEDVRQIIADVVDEYGGDAEKLEEAIDEHLRGDGVTDLNGELEDAPSAVGSKALAKSADCDKDKDDEDHESDHDSDDDDSKDDKPDFLDDKSSAVIKEALTAKDFVLLADAISKAPGVDTNQLAQHFANYLATTNPAFDRERFIAAATGNPSTGRDVFQGEVPLEAEPNLPGMTPPTASITRVAGLEYDHDGFIWATVGGEKMGPFNSEEEARQVMQEAAAEQLGQHADPTINPGEQPPGYDPRIGTVRVGEAPRDGGGAVTTESLPTGDDSALGGPSPKIDKKEWKPNALNENGNLKPIDSEQSGSPHPTETQDVNDTPDHTNDFLEQTNAVTEQQSLPTADESGQSTERNIEQPSTDTFNNDGQADPVTSEVQSSVDPDRNPLKAILESGFATDHQVESAINEFEGQEKE